MIKESNNMNVKTIGVLAILGASIMWAIEPIFAKLSYVNSDFLQTSAVRAIFVALIALIYTFVTNKGNLKINKKQFSVLVYLALAGTLIADLLYFFALTTIPVINAVLIGHMQPIFIILIGFFILKEDKLTKFDYFGIFFMILAGLLVTTKTLTNLAMLKFGTLGDLIVVLASLIWATTNIAMRKYLRNMNAGVITFYRFLIASFVFSLYLLPKSLLVFSNVYQILVGVVVGIGTILYYEGLKRLKAAQASGLELSAPFFAALLGFFVLEEVVTVMQILGIALLVIGVYFISKKEKVYS